VRVIRHPRIDSAARDWLRETDARARALHYDAERVRAEHGDRALREDMTYLGELLDGCVAWVRLALMPLALPAAAADGATSPLQIALRRLGVTDASEATVDEIMRRHYLRVLEACGGSPGIAAQILGVSRRTIQRFLLEPSKRHRR
jgi:hypothetical protein